LSVDQEGSLESVGLALGYALLFWAMRDLGREPRLRTAVAVAASYALVFWLVMVATWWMQEKIAWVSVFGSIPNLESNQVFIWGTANVFPILTLLAIPLLRWQPPGLPRRVLIGLWAVSSVIVIPLSNGRASWVGLAVAAVAYDAFSGWPRVRAGAEWLRGRRLLVPAAGCGRAGCSGRRGGGDSGRAGRSSMRISTGGRRSGARRWASSPPTRSPARGRPPTRGCACCTCPTTAMTCPCAWLTTYRC